MTLKEAKYILDCFDDKSAINGFLHSNQTTLALKNYKKLLRATIADACMVQCLQKEEEENLYAKASV
jgi:hypothetical protein